MQLLSPNKLAAAMRATDTTQSSLAAAVGVTQPAVRYWLQKPRDASASLVVRISKFLDVPISALLDDYPGTPADLPISRACDIADRWSVEIVEVAK